MIVLPAQGIRHAMPGENVQVFQMAFKALQ